MKPDLSAALDAVEMTYAQIIAIATDMTKQMFDPIDSLINDIKRDGSGMPPDKVRDYMLRLQVHSYEISEFREKSALKAECAETLRKEKYAQVFNVASGTTGTKDNTALLETSNEIVVESLYNLVANILKTKLDELHRMVAVLQSINVSKMQEAKFLYQNTSIGDPSEKTYLVE